MSTRGPATSTSLQSYKSHCYANGQFFRLQKVSEDVPIEIGTAIDDTRDPRNVNDAPGDAHTENDPERHDDETNVPNAADKDGEVSSEAARDNEDESDTSDDTHAIAVPEQQTKSMEVLPQEREINVGATNVLTEADNEKEESNEAARDNEKKLDIIINDDAPAIAAPKQQTEFTEASPQKREIIVDNGHNSITGRYPLFELLSLSTTSGAISVAVVPQPADPMNPDEPARLRIRSQSGSISVSFTAPAVASVPELEAQMVECAEYGNGKYQNPHTLPLRPYEIEIETDSGTISGCFIISTSVHLSSKSGSINANLIPIASDLEQSVSILTQTTSGSQQIHLTNPVYLYNSQRDGSRSSATRAPAAHFSHGGGSMQIRYPSDWIGIVRAPPGSGSTSLVGQGMNVVQREDGSVEGCISGNGRGDWWGASGMDVSLGSRGAAMFLVG